MNRRRFFGMSVAAVLAAGLPLSVLPERKLFLAPAGGFWTGLPMRESAQYVINQDACLGRFDVQWVTAAGEREAAWINEYGPITGLQLLGMEEGQRRLSWENYFGRHRESARERLGRLIPAGARVVKPNCPQRCEYARVTI